MNDAGEGNSHVDICTVSCVSCGEEVSRDATNDLRALSTNVLSTKDDESETFLKQLQKAQNEGLSIEYRCPRCRSCNDCRRSFETERVSLREEAEDLMIWNLGQNPLGQNPLGHNPLGQKHFWTKSHRTKSPMIISPRTKSPKIRIR